MSKPLSTLRRAALPALVILTGAQATAAAQASAPDPLSLGGVSVASAASAAPASAPPKSGRLVRVVHKQLTVANGSTVAVRLRATTVAIGAELRVGKYGRVVDRAKAGPGERFRLAGRVSSGERLRVMVHRTDGGTERNNVALGAVRRMRATVASWYGPGLFGNRTACGQTLTAGLRGVAHKRLPCGTKLTIRHGGRSTTAVVVDRGPFHSGREFDLTQATARAIGFNAVGRVWVSR